MLNAYEGTPIYRYEDFCSDPDSVLKTLCQSFDIPYDVSYKTAFLVKNLQGIAVEKNKNKSEKLIHCHVGSMSQIILTR